MANQVSSNNHSDRKAYIITGPTSGIGRATAFEVAKHGAVALVGRDREKLSDVQKAIEQKGGRAMSVVCDLSDMASVRHAAATIIDLHLSLAGLVNNAGTYQMRPTKSAQDWDTAFATNHLGLVMKYGSTPKQAARVITKVLLNECGDTGVYYDNEGNPMLASVLVRDPKFTARVVTETRSLLATSRA